MVDENRGQGRGSLGPSSSKVEKALNPMPLHGVGNW